MGIETETPTGEQKKQLSREEFVKAINEKGINELMKKLPGGKLRLDKDEFDVKDQDLLRHYLNKLNLWSYDEMVQAGMTASAIEEVGKYLGLTFNEKSDYKIRREIK